jgi:hypothetical protein
MNEVLDDPETGGHKNYCECNEEGDKDHDPQKNRGKSDLS